MNEPEMNLKGEEKTILSLRSLYASYGYQPYRMSRFEEYDLYSDNKDFLPSGNIITFTDTDGRLLALKPDVTLSIVKNLKENRGYVNRIFYDENVYRVSDRFGTFREITQAGVECVGDIGILELSEAAVLAQKSLKIISQDCVLMVSHMGIVEDFLKELGSEELSAKALEALKSKNTCALEAQASEYPEKLGTFLKLEKLAMLSGDNCEIYDQLMKLGAKKEALEELKSIISVLDSSCARIDFSVLGGMKYYNGITFRGYIRGIPVPVVSGGQYDKLMKRMNRSSKAIGFAVYMDTVERMFEKPAEYDVDTVVLYKDRDSVEAVMKKTQEIRNSGKTATALKKIPEKLRYREIVSMEGGNADA